MNTEFLKSKLLEAAFDGSLTGADTSIWKEASLLSVTKSVGNRSNHILASAVKEEGKFKVVSQGQPLFDGFYDDESKVINDLPIIIFGDHTRCVKYIDFPFVIGADGTKCLKADGIDAKYLYYWIKYAAGTISNKGYARHFSLLKAIPVPLPPLVEQQRIVAALEEGFAAIDAIASAKENLSTTAEMLRSKILQAAFDGSLTGADTSTWEKGELGKLADILYGFPFQASLFNEREEGHPIIRIRDIKPSKTKTYSPEVCDDKYHIRNGDMLVGMDGNFNVCLWAGGDAYLNQRVCKITAREDKLLQKYLYYYLPIYLKELEYWVKSVTVKHLSDKHLKNMPIPLPPLVEQQRIVAKIEELFEQINRLSEAKA